MSADQINLVKRSWSVFRRIDPVLVGDVFYEKLFTDFPALRKMFRTSRMEQSVKLVDMLSVIVGRLHALDELTEDIRALAIRHTHYGVRPVHFQAVGLALLWTLEQGLGPDWNAATADAWQSCYNHLSATMINAMQ